MATVTWVGTTSSAWGTGTNWTGGAEPSTGDTVYIDGAVSIDGVDKSAVNLAALIIRETYTGQFGTSAANPVKVACAGECSVLGGLAVYLNSGGSNPIVNLIVNMPTPATIFDIGGTVTYAEMNRGSITSAATYTALTLEPTDGNKLNMPQPTLTGGTITTLDALYADLWITTASTLTTLNLHDGVCWNYAGTLTTVNIIGRTAEFKHYHTATITTINVKGGRLNAAVDRRTKTITNVIQHINGKVSAGNVTLTNSVKTPARLAATDFALSSGGGGLGDTP